MRWVSPRGTIEVLDDYPYWVGQEVRLFRRHRDHARAGPDGGDRDHQAGRPGPVGHGLSVPRRLLARPRAGHPARPRSGTWAPTTSSASPSPRARSPPIPRSWPARRSCWARSAGRRSAIRAGPARRRPLEGVQYAEAGTLWGQALKQGQGDAALCWEGLRAQWTGQGLEFDYLLPYDFSKLPANSFVIRKADFEDAEEEAALRGLSAGWAMGLEFGHQQPARGDPDRARAVPRRSPRP